MSALADLAIIRQKVRNVTATQSPNELSDDEIDFYINTYLIYDFPERLRLQTLRTNYTFFTKANIDVYDFPVEQYISLQKPIYVAGYEVEYMQNQEAFYNLWPKLNFIQQVATGDGATVNPTLTNLTNLPALRGSVSLSTLISGSSVSFLDNSNGVFLSGNFTIIGITQAASAIVTLNTVNHPFAVTDSVFISNVLGMSQINGGAYTITAVAGAQITINIDSTSFGAYSAGGDMQKQSGTVNYITGAISLNWGNAPDLGAAIQAQYVPYVASRPRTAMFFHNQIILRPVPDQAYRVETEVYAVPTQLLSSGQLPELRQWWQLIALGASLKILEDTQNMDDYRNVFPLYQDQETLANRRTIKQLTAKRVQTPYADGPGFNPGFNDFYGS